MSININISAKGGGLVQLAKAIELLVNRQLLVGIPEGAPRDDAGGMTDAELGYLREHGSPIHNTPASPFLVPGIAQVQPQIEACLEQAAVAALDASPQGTQRHLHAAGAVAKQAVKDTLNASMAASLQAGDAAGIASKPKAITYVLREKG